jgi:hypothetical protein
MIAVGGSTRAAEADVGGGLYEVSRPDGADERAASRAASGAISPGHLHAADDRRLPAVRTEHGPQLRGQEIHYIALRAPAQ